MIQLTNVTLKRGATTLFTGLDLTVHAGHRAGVVGRNGVGKTSLFLLLRGRLLPEEGDVRVPRSWTIAHLAQETEASASTALDWAMDGDRPLRAVQRRIEAAETQGDDRRLAALYAELEALDGYTAEARAGQILHGLGFEAEDLSRPVAGFSGGWRIRLNLAQTLMCRSDLLLLDEPTNHLDLDAVMWLEQWLVRRDRDVPPHLPRPGLPRPDRDRHRAPLERPRPRLARRVLLVRAPAAASASRPSRPRTRSSSAGRARSGPSSRASGRRRARPGRREAG